MNDYNPNIFEFETKNNNKYIFDNCKGVVIPSSQEISYIINNFEKSKEIIIQNLKNQFSLSEIESLPIYNYVNDLVNEGMLFPNNSQVISNKKISYENLLNTPTSQLVLILTESCNMRCKYCIYSNYYPGVKSYSNKDMTVKTALKAVNKYINFHKEKQKRGNFIEPRIIFYGGEPFLKFNIIKSVINYCEKKNFKPTFHVTTNGTIMSDDIIDFIIEKNIVVLFSLDGNKENHDRNRVKTNNEPTFDYIMENIKKLQEKKRTLGKVQYIYFNVTFDLETDMEKVIDFFDKNDNLFFPYSVRYSKVGDFGTNYYKNKDLKNNVLNSSLCKLYERFCTLLTINKANSISTALKGLYSTIGLVNNKAKFVNEDRKEICMPGAKIAVSPDEKIYICERVNQSCPIGTLDEDFCLEKINSLVNKFINIINEHCSNCNISRLCDICYSQMIYNNDLTFSKEACASTKSTLKNALISLYSLLEDNEKATEEFLNLTSV